MTDIVTKVDIDKARKLVAKASEVEEKIRQAKACGIECDEDDERCQHAKKALIQMIQVFGERFPHRQS